MNKILFVFTLVFILSLPLAACTANGTPTQDPTVVLGNYDQALAYFNQIEIGMTYEQVAEIIGVAGVQPKNEPTPSGMTQSVPSVPLPPGYIWHFGEDLSSIYYHYNENRNSGPTGTKIFSWDLFDLAYRKDAISTLAQYNQIEVGMTYDQVKAIMGSLGRLSSVWESVRLDQPYTVTSDNGFPSLMITTKSTQMKTYFWWTDASDIGAKSMLIGFVDDMVSSK